MKHFFTTKLLFVLIFNLIIFNTLFGQTTPTCTPTTTPLCTFMGPPNFPFYLGSFTLNSVGPINSSPNCTGYSTNTTAFPSSNLTPGQSYSINITEGGLFTFNYKIAIWFDINDDGDFVDVGEELFQGNSSSVVYNGNITIPNATTSGLHYMRVMIHNNQSATLTPCGTFSLGETEDYVVQIAGGGCTPTISNNSPVSVGGSIALTSSTADTYSWTGPNAFTSSSQNPTINSATAINSGVYSLSITTGTCTATATTNVTVNPPAVLVANYSFCGNANDATSNANNGTINGATPTLDRFENLSAYLFSSSNNIIITSNTALQLGVGNYSLSYWIKTTANDGVIMGKGPHTLMGMMQYINAGGTIEARSEYPSGIINSTHTINDNLWHNVVFTRNGTSVRIYIDGVLSNIGVVPLSNISNSENLTIGHNGPNPFVGSLDDVKIYSGVLSNSEILAEFNSSAGCQAQQNCTPTISSNSPVSVGGSIALTSSTADTYSWTGPNAFTSSSQNPTINSATAINSGIYSLSITTGTCTATATSYVSVTNNGVTPPCQPTITTTCTININNFTVNGISVNSGCGLPPNVNSTAFASATFYKGQSYTFSLSAGGFWNYSIWIDNNNDGDFSDVGETIVPSGFAATTTSGNILIPILGTIGNKTLRIIASPTNSPTDACGSYAEAEVEDYIINVQCPTTFSPSSNTPVCIGSPINLLSNLTASTYAWSDQILFRVPFKTLKFQLLLVRTQVLIA